MAEPPNTHNRREHAAVRQRLTEKPLGPDSALKRGLPTSLPNGQLCPEKDRPILRPAQTTSTDTDTSAREPMTVAGASWKSMPDVPAATATISSRLLLPALEDCVAPDYCGNLRQTEAVLENHPAIPAPTSCLTIRGGYGITRPWPDNGL